MDDARFDDLSRRIASRRTALGGLAAIAALAAPLVPQALAGRKKKKKKPKKCAAGAVRCGAACVNLQTDAQNCGGCGNRCGGGVACEGGACQPPANTQCPNGQTRCGGQCVDTGSNEAHCGGCSQQCQGDLTCVVGACVCASAGETKCGNSCVDTRTDEDHCGRCGNACSPGQHCSNSACAPDDDLSCVFDADCDAKGIGLQCQGNRCVCRTAGEGFCRRRSDGFVRCDACCGSNPDPCPGDQVCRENELIPGWFSCDCPSGKQACAGSNNFLCQSPARDHRNRCGINCEDCQAIDPANAQCCGGRCRTGCAPYTDGNNCGANYPCPGNNCEPCPAGTLCCNKGQGSPAQCVPPEAGIFYRCPGPDSSPPERQRRNKQK